MAFLINRLSEIHWNFQFTFSRTENQFHHSSTLTTHSYQKSISKNHKYKLLLFFTEMQLKNFLFFQKHTITQTHNTRR